jgi:hypothetical protein
MKAKKTRKPTSESPMMTLNLITLVESMVGDPEKWARLTSDSFIPDDVEEKGASMVSYEPHVHDAMFDRSLMMEELMAEWPILHAMWLNLRSLYVLYKSVGDAYDVDFYQWLITRKGNRDIREGLTGLLNRKDESLFVQADRMLMLEIALGNYA